MVINSTSSDGTWCVDAEFLHVTVPFSWPWGKKHVVAFRSHVHVNNSANSYTPLHTSFCWQFVNSLINNSVYYITLARRN